MDTNVNVTYKVSLTSKEFRIVTLALSGKRMSKEDTVECLALSKRLLALRASTLKHMSKVADDALNSASKKEETKNE